MSYVVEWSPKQQCFHLQKLEDMIEDNLKVFRGRFKTDYLCIGLFETYESASDFIRRLTEIARARNYLSGQYQN